MGPKKRPPTDEDEEVITPLRLSKRRRQGADLSDILNGFADSLKELKCEEEDRLVSHINGIKRVSKYELP